MAGFRLAPGLPKACATSTPHSTAIAQPAVITIQPESAAYDLRSVTPAFTPLPNSTRTSVPRNSPNQTECIASSSKCVMGASNERSIHPLNPKPDQNHVCRL